MDIEKYIDNIFNDVDKNIKLDETQKNVVLDESDSLIVVAGAGTGKTTTITAKVKYLVDIKKITPKDILIISFTNKAIDELKNRINIDFKIDAKICTFHKFAYDILKEYDARYKINTNYENEISKIIKKEKESRKIIRVLKKDKVYKKQDKYSLNSYDTLIKFTQDIIKMIKTLDIDINALKSDNKKTIKYINYLKLIYDKYQMVMKKDFQCDFEDLILDTIKLKEIKCNYKYIIVDEYQDISLSRFNLLKHVIEFTHAKTIVVGDDFQAIFSFAGSDINLFLDFQKIMNARLIKITNTYRNSQELIDVAGKFIMQDNALIKKKMNSIKHKDKPIKIYGYKNNFDEVFTRIINELINEYGVDKNILVLGRYNNDILKIKSHDFIIKNDNIIYKKNRSVIIKFMTVHASKGLGFDNVILINFENSIMGFPSNIEDSKIKRDILNIGDNLKEERRLFYVALTRTKNNIYIMSPIGKESSFIKDLTCNNNVYIDYKLKLIKKYSNHKIR